MYMEAIILKDNILKIKNKFIKHKKHKQKTKNKGNNMVACYSFLSSCPLFRQPRASCRQQSHALGREGRNFLPSSEIEDREEKADYFTVVVLRRLEIEESARVRGT